MERFDLRNKKSSSVILLCDNYVYIVNYFYIIYVVYYLCCILHILSIYVLFSTSITSKNYFSEEIGHRL